MSTANLAAKKWCRRFAASSPAYELYAPKKLRWRALGRAALGALLALVSFGRIHAQVVFPDFSSTSNLVLTDAVGMGGNVLLAASNRDKRGAMFYASALPVSQFSTRFEFRISSPGGQSDGTSAGADGIAFVIQREGVNSIGSFDSGLGYGGIGQSIAIEFDTFQNTNLEGNTYIDPDSNHVGLNLHGSMASLLTQPVASAFDQGQVWTAWVDYDGATLELRLSESGVRPASALLSYSIDLAATLGGSTAYFGFTGSTGKAYGDHELLSWVLQENSAAIPEPGTYALLAAGLGFLLVGRRRICRG